MSERPNGDEARGPDDSDRDWGAEWQALSAGLQSEGVGSNAPPVPRPSRRPGSFRIGDRPRFGAGSGPRDYTPPPEDDSWEPPEPPPATGSRMARLAWAGIIGGPLMLLLALIAFRNAPAWYVASGVAVFVAGCVIAFLQLPQRRRDPDDDGAEV